MHLVHEVFTTAFHVGLSALILWFLISLWRDICLAVTGKK